MKWEKLILLTYIIILSPREDMRAWIHDISEGESAFDNEDINKRPHKIVDGENCCS